MREQTRVNSTRLLALVLLIALAYSLSTFQGHYLQQTPLVNYVSRLHKGKEFFEPHHSNFTMGLLTYAWVNAMTLWSELAQSLISLKPHKWLYFQRGLKALSQLQQTLEPCCHP